MKSITSKELIERLNAGKSVKLIDVREPYENAEFNIGGTLIPPGEINEHLHEFEGPDEIIVYCAKGIRSQVAIQRLEQKMDTSHLVNLIGGINYIKQYI